MPSKRLLSVGQCGFDHANISRFFQRRFQAEVVAAHSADEALQELRGGSYDLVLVNRVLDADGSEGLDLIKRVKSDAELSQIPMILVSNYPDAQQEAVAAGAEPGFGKAALEQAPTVEKLQKYF